PGRGRDRRFPRGRRARHRGTAVAGAGGDRRGAQAPRRRHGQAGRGRRAGAAGCDAMSGPAQAGGGNRFNVSEWGLAHRSLVLYFLIVSTLIGIYAYGLLGQSEDPPFTFKIMVVRAEWPGAS